MNLMRPEAAWRRVPLLPLLLLLLLTLAQCGDDAEPAGADGAVGDAAVDAAVAPVVGAPCADDKACGNHGGHPMTCLLQHNGVTWLGGYCALPCDKQAPACPKGAACEREPIYSALDAAHCFLECTTDQDCRPGYWCSPASYVCYPKARP
jgi:hypothetical protein